MHFEVDMKMDLRRLVALNALAEKTFRRGQMLVFRLVMLALGGWLSWTAGRTLLAEGIRFDQTCKLLTGLLVLAIGLFTNTISAWLNQMTIIPDGKLSFGEKFFTEKSKYQKTQHRYSDIFALKSYRGYDFIGQAAQLDPGAGWHQRRYAGGAPPSHRGKKRKTV